MNIKENKGITLIALIITIVILLILAGVTIYGGTETIKKANLETLRTNMLLIKVKSREYCEEANFKVGVNANPSAAELQKGIDYIKNTSENGGKGLSTVASAEDLQKVGATVDGENGQYAAKLTSDNLIDMGLKEVENSTKNGDYLVKFDVKNNTVEVYNTKGFKSNNGTKYSLTEIEKIED